jgi:hypothetical protein
MEPAKEAPEKPEKTKEKREEMKQDPLAGVQDDDQDDGQVTPRDEEHGGDMNFENATAEELRERRAREEELMELQLSRKEAQFKLKMQELHHKLELERLSLGFGPQVASTPNPFVTPQMPQLTPMTSAPLGAREDPMIQMLELSRQQLQSQVDCMRLPPTDLIKFDGNPLKYWQFIKLFTSVVDKDTVSDDEKLTRLHQFTEGKAREAITHCLYSVNSSLGYRNALERLKDRFGNPHTISQAWVEKILKFGDVKTNAELRDFADQLRGCRDTLVAMNCEDELSGRRTLVDIIRKLPLDLRSKWLNENYKITSAGRLPRLDDVVKFVETEAEKRSDPVFGGVIGSTKSQAGAGSKNVKPARQTFSTNVSAKNKKKTVSVKCFKCDENHFLNQCDQFRQMSVPERTELVMKKGLCKNCFQPGHAATACTRNWVCNVPNCGEKHNRWLHPNSTTTVVKKAPPSGNQASESGNVVCGFAGSSAGKICLPIVPVIVKGPTQISTVTHALLDPGATTSLVSESLTRQLKIKGRPGKIDLDTVSGSNEGLTSWCVDLELQSLYDNNIYPIKGVRTLKNLNINLNCTSTVGERQRWEHLKDLKLPEITSEDVHLIIGQDAPRLLRPEELRIGKENDPYATRTVLGWAINGPIDQQGHPRARNFFLKSDTLLQNAVESFWKLEEPVAPDRAMSYEDAKVYKTWEQSVEREGPYYSLKIPFRDEKVTLPNNKFMAEQRLQSLGRRLTRDPQLHEKYSKAMEAVQQNGYAEEVPVTELNRDDGKVWYIPHHPVTHPRKPEKVRVVYDCAAKFDGVCLNDVVSQGPDLTNKLLDVLIKFRQEPIAVMADIEGMFFQVRVAPEDRDVLRFLWWANNDPAGEVRTYRMKSHLFGGVWSPSCASFALRRCATDYASLYDVTAASTVRNNFYVDDCLKSTNSVQSATRLVAQLTSLLSNGGFRLTKWTSNCRDVLKCIPEEEHAKGVLSLDLGWDLPMERALGTLWKLESDTFGFAVGSSLLDKPRTKRGVLSVTSSIYDPLGLAGPFVLRGKMLFQLTCREHLGWDEMLSDDLNEQWQKWLDDLPKLKVFSVPRCLKPRWLLQPPIEAQLHHFCDASEKAYGAVSYLRLVDDKDQIHCSIVMSKNKLAPMRSVTIPRLELCAATVAVDMDCTLREYLETDLSSSVFWTDSTIVLSYLNNEKRRFQTFVANRVAKIRENSDPCQWRHVETSSNPADDISRGLKAQELIDNPRWISGPAFLWETEQNWPTQPKSYELPPEAEVKVNKDQVYVASSQRTLLEDFLCKYSSWYRLKRAVGWLLLFKDTLKRKSDTKLKMTVAVMKRAELAIFDYLQQNYLTPNLKDLRNLSPVRLDDGLLHVGGRLSNAPIPAQARFPVILPAHHHVTDLIIRDVHVTTGHSGVERVLAELRQSVWILKGRTPVKAVLSKCMTCKKTKTPLATQKMADLPVERVTPNALPFSQVGVDYFGPFIVKRGRSEVKRYGCVFTCLATRAIHLEVAHSLDTDSFINAVERFVARRGKVKLIRSDNGTNFVGARAELKKALDEWNQDKIADHMLQREIEWKFNPPYASHMGGVWERQIRTIRAILLNLTSQQTLDDERLATLMCIVENIVNGRPLTKLSDDPNDLTPLRPNDLLVLNSGPSLPPGKFVHQDALRRRWRQVQYLADVFWTRWVKEYLPSLQQRQKWLDPVRNFEVGDLVLILNENSPRYQWPLGIVTDTNKGPDGLVRSVQVRTKTGTYTRPIHKLCLLEANMD